MRLLDLKNREVELPSKADSNFWDSKTIGHPRPLLKRSGWQSLDGIWKFAFDNEGKCVQPKDLKHWSHHIESIWDLGHRGIIRENALFKQFDR